MMRNRQSGARGSVASAFTGFRFPPEVILLAVRWYLRYTGQYENNRCECDHGRLKARLRPMRGLKTNRTASVVIRGHGFIQNLRRGQYELGVGAAPALRLATAFAELKLAI
jgi:transposase-like protein